MRRRRRDRERGTAAVEFALLLPVFVLLFSGLVEMGLLFNAWVTVEHAAELGARFGVTGRESCPSGAGNRYQCILGESRAGMQHLRNANSATITVTSWAYPSYTIATNNSAGRQCDAIEVRVQYTYQTMTPIIAQIVPSLTLTGRQRFINEPFGACRAT